MKEPRIEKVNGVQGVPDSVLSNHENLLLFCRKYERAVNKILETWKDFIKE